MTWTATGVYVTSGVQLHTGYLQDGHLKTMSNSSMHWQVIQYTFIVTQLLNILKLKYIYCLLFLLCFTLYLRAISKYKPPPGGGGALYLERGFKGGFFALRVWGALEGLIFGILRYLLQYAKVWSYPIKTYPIFS